MRKLISSICFAVVISIQFSCNIQPIDAQQSVNPIVGDLSFINKFGHKPRATDNEDLRIKTHLEYAENILRQKDISTLSPELQEKRSDLLDHLHDYRLTGTFPRNYDHRESRKPCFIDRDNRICAVGYLIEKTAGRQTAEAINNNHKYDEVLAMNDDVVDRWIASSGLSKEECAIIQPTYGPTPVYTLNYISPGYGISSAVLGGVNLSLNTLNAVQLSKGANSKTIAIAALISGAGQTVLGAFTFPKTSNTFYGNTTNESRKTLSMVNIGLGTTTMLLSTWNLMTNIKPADKRMTYNLSSFETPNNQIGMAFTLKRRL